MSDLALKTALSFFVVVVVAPASWAVDVDSPYGVVAFVPSPTRWDRIAGAGIGWGRCDFSWRMVETAQDVFDWSTTDQEVAEANARGVRIYGGLGYTPAWASTGGRSQDPPRNPADWYDYVYRCVSRYKASVKHWEIWNEPNISGFWAGTRSQFINNILKVASDAAHAADPDCMVLAPELSRCCSCNTWMTECLQQAGDKIDIICFHQYDYTLPSGRLAAIDQMHNLIISLGYANKPIWITECGWGSDESGMTEQKQGEYLVAMLAGMHARSSWWHNFFWYQIWEGPPGSGQAGLLYQDESPKPSWYTYRDHTAANPPPERVSVNLSTNDIVDGLTPVVVGDGDTVPATQASRACRRNDNPAEDYYVYFDVDDTFALAGNRPALAILCDYYDGGSGSITLQYDSSSGPYTTAGTVNRAGVNTWKQARWNVTDAWFANRQNNGADFRVSGGVDSTFYVDVVAVTAPPRPGPGRASVPSPSHLVTDVNVNADLSWTAGTGATSHNVYFGPSSPGTYRGNQAGTTYDPGTLLGDTTYYWRIDEVNVEGTTSGYVWSFTTQPIPPGKATSPRPVHRATSVGLDADLSWTAGSGATSHDVYFGMTDPPDARGNQAATTYDPGTLIRRTTYYWRVDEVNAVGTTTGDLWSFITEGVAADSDRDGDVDQEDFGRFQACLSGCGVARVAGCGDADLDADRDVDQDDFAVFQGCMGGANLPPAC